jgi:3-oxoacyl-[acyl-carrier protein] reductase
MRQIAWVTGASSGIGLAIARHLLATGWQVRGLDLQDAKIEQVGYTHAAINLASAEAIEQLLREEYETPLAFVHAAGIMQTASLGALDTAAGELMWRVHVQAATLLANALLPRMQVAQAGRMVLIGSRVSGGMPGRSQYAATKAALVSNMRSWASEVVSDGVTVNLISPAATDTPMLSDGKRSSSTPRLPPIGRLIAPEEIAQLTGYLLSDAAAAITGQDIAICGGASLPV